MSPTESKQRPAKKGPARKASSTGFSAEERAAMKERVKEMKAEGRRASRANKQAEEEAEVLAKIAAMPDHDRAMAERVHEIVKASAPDLSPRTWYGMPAYAKEGKVICFFRDAAKFKTRYATFGFSDKANLDSGAMWATDFAVKELTPTEEAKIAELVKQAVS
jgi:uncharacterized protein YdhG (YjbR/CyaY superfamily)